MAQIPNEELLKRIGEKFDQQVTVVGEPYGLLTVETGREQIIDLLTFLKTDAALRFIFLTDITGIHYPEQAGKEIGVIYHLHSLTTNTRIRLKVFLADGD